MSGEVGTERTGGELPDPVVGRIVVADARPVVRAGLAHAVGGLGEVVQIAPTEVIATVGDDPPGVLVVGLRVDDRDTFPVIAAATAACDDLKVLLVADGATVIDLREAVIAGVTSFLLASAPIGEIRDATRSTAQGERIISPSIAIQLADSRRQGEQGAGASSLTARELEVLQLLAEGLTNEGIGERLGLTARTVKTHVQHLLTKLEMPDRTGAVARGFRLGLIR